MLHIGMHMCTPSNLLTMHSYAFTVITAVLGLPSRATLHTVDYYNQLWLPTPIQNIELRF